MVGSTMPNSVNSWKNYLTTTTKLKRIKPKRLSNRKILLRMKMRIKEEDRCTLLRSILELMS